MQDLDISIKNSYRTAVAEARGSYIHIFLCGSFAEVRFAGICHCVFYISYEQHIKILYIPGVSSGLFKLPFWFSPYILVLFK